MTLRELAGFPVVLDGREMYTKTTSRKSDGDFALGGGTLDMITGPDALGQHIEDAVLKSSIATEPDAVFGPAVVHAIRESVGAYLTQIVAVHRDTQAVEVRFQAFGYGGVSQVVVSLAGRAGPQDVRSI